jgi:FtsH-binding integral membrane protein
MTSTTPAAAPAPLTRAETSGLVGQTMGLVALTAAIFTLGAYLGRDSSPGWAWVWFIAAFGVLFAMNVAAERSEQLSVALLFAFGLLLGLAVAPALHAYAGADRRAVYEAGGATALFIAALGAVGYSIRQDLSSYIRYFLWALTGLIIFGVILIFVHFPGGAVIYSLAGLGIFAGLTLFDFQRLRTSRDIRTAPLLAASIFIDALNVFLLMLSLFGGEE